ncbi:isochorismatase family protein [Photobacterium japonica]|uniref:isochorismatase family protein n=1 Tax=Photobacterium japonica TaxID=2910235 RepID=UPI003D10239C
MVSYSHVASFDVDPQNTFTPVCPDELPVPGGNEIADELNQNAKFASKRILSRDGHPKDALWVAQKPEQVLTAANLTNVDLYWPAHAVIGTLGFDLIEGLPHPVMGYDYTVTKGIDSDCHPYGACYHDLANTRSTGVIEYLKLNNITTIIVGGLALEFCVKTTVEQLMDAGFQVIINLASTRALSADGQSDTLAALRKKPGFTLVESHAQLADAIQHLNNDIV